MRRRRAGRSNEKGAVMKSVIVAVAAVMLAASAVTAQTYVAGTTYCSSQHPGSCGRMIAVDSLGFAHVVWMKLMISQPLGSRRVYYNLWDPGSGGFVFPQGGAVVDVLIRAGYACLAMNQSGWCYPAYHGISPVSLYNRVYVSMDLMPGLGIFNGSSPDVPVDSADYLYPRIAQDVDSHLHLLSVSPLADVDLYGLYYSRGTPLFDPDGYGMEVEWDSQGTSECAFVDTARGLLNDIAASRISSRLARAWAKPGGQVVDLWIQHSTDGGLSWLAPFNVTQFIPPDSDCFAATSNALCCDRDTWRLKSDLSLLFDAADQLHVAFTTVAYYHWPVPPDTESEQPTKAIIWHWCETGGSFSVIVPYWIPDSLLSTDFPLAPGHAIVERPSLSLDWSTGDLYCSYILYDTSAWSTSGALNGDVFVSVSADNGARWSVGTNVTDTRPAVVPAPSGQNQNEQDATLADRVASNRLHLFYLLDQSGFDDEIPSSNAMIYRRVPTDSIARGPLYRSDAFHVTVVECDTINRVESRTGVAAEYRLERPFPNPFNSRTLVSFALPARARIRLNVYDVLGREVQTVLDGWRGAGRHFAEWAPQGLGSGLYFVRLESPFGRRSQKVVYIR